MIEYIKGTVEFVTNEKVVVEANGLGYGVYSSTKSLSDIHVGASVTLFTYYSVREDSISLYGFATKTELDMFKKLISVTKIGPKAAIGILSTFTVETLCQQIATQNIAMISKAPGVGKKTAERIVLELKDKVKDLNVLDNKENSQSMQDMLFEDEILEALLSLGYQQQEAKQAIMAVASEATTTEAGLKAALAWLLR
ncbi:Holliday junction branch migration protein RuvA [Tindallia californiensis]|uniref:Holliday junction branch migration complex subunit RuvA n=1 Tax=Tindallia californiensis TaxID=159292 RepID=A0A1H3NFT9_9FIRM|nr:Holliday junction branch migration protein RuvA [Tindallia californiensis]SDY87049.1 Holliday junction DNA helicase subunit RuvA [Tindallia californiensis]